MKTVGQLQKSSFGLGQLSNKPPFLILKLVQHFLSTMWQKNASPAIKDFNE